MSKTAVEHNPQAIIDSLAACQTPLLIGVRHHSAAIARAIDTLLERFAPTTVLVELPSDFAPWLEYLADTETQAPVAISAVDATGALGFYPLADFSPELVAVRWAIKHGVPVIPCDLSVSARLTENERSESTPQPDTDTGFEDLLAALMRRTQANDTGQLWERLVESPAMTTDAEDVRKAGLTFGWAVRSSHAKIDARDLLREAVMRQAIRDASGRTVAIVGAFHAPALTATAIEAQAAADAQLLQATQLAPETVGVSLVPYGFEQLDERSGYPAGIRDPVWHQRMFAAETSSAMDAAAVELVVDICRSMRARGHVAGTPDASEVIRMMRDLANLRRLPAAGRSELIEAMETCLAHGELNGRAREIAKAAEPVLIGRRRGSVSPRTPRCGLALAIDELLASFALPTSAEAKELPREIRLDILRSPRDRAKAVNLRRLCVAGIPYAERLDTIATGERENLTERWQVGWKQGTAATIESVARFGVTLPQAVAGMLTHRYQQAQARLGEPSGDTLHPVQLLERLELAAECGLNELLMKDMSSLSGMYLKTAGLPELTKALTLWGRIEAGHVAALPVDDAHALPPHIARFDPIPFANLPTQLLEATLQRLEGIAGSNDKHDINSVCDLTQWFYDNPARNAQRLIHWCEQTLQRGGDGMRGLSAGVLALFEKLDRQQLAELIGGWFDAAANKQGRQQLRGRLTGLTQVLFPHMVCDPSWLAGLEDRLLTIGDEGFIQRLPAIRGAFQEFSPADRQRLLRVRLEPHSDRGVALRLDVDDSQVVADAGLWAATLRDSDLRGKASIHEVMPDFDFAIPKQVPTNPATDLPKTSVNLLDQQADHKIPIADRWRMILGVPPEEKSQAARAACRLDELYGHGKGEGSRDGIGNRDSMPRGGDDQAPQPTLLEWSDDLEQLFGSDVCQEVMAEAIELGNVAAVNLLDPNRVTPSIDLLRQVLSLAGGLPEQRAEKLRKLAKRITASLAEQLAVRLQPALNGLASTRPTRRRSRKLYLRRTIHENLANVYRRQNGKPSVIAKRLVFHSTARREMDWHLTFVVDVSGSMTASVIYSAICAAVFSELPALSVSFLAFSTEVIDLSDKVVDPLSLLLEVQVGGGTRIGLGLAAARAKISIPQRTLLVLVSDFEEGVSVGEMLGEIRGLAESGVRCLGLAALDDSGVARFHQGYANLAASVGMSVAAVAPEQLARWVGDQIRGHASGAAQPQPTGAV